jgi:pyrroloquinoline quinone biosynthesis protein A
MKIMSPESKISRCGLAPQSPQWTAYLQTGCRYIAPQSADQHHRRNSMKWEKPAASDMRFGFEITMYIANR